MADAKPNTVNAATPDARAEVDASPTLKDVASTSSDDPRAKKPRFNKPNPGKRHGSAYHAKDKPVSSLNIVPRLLFFPIFVSNLGARDLAADCYRIIAAKDYRLGNAISCANLQYVTCLAFLNRAVQCAVQCGYAFPPEVSRLKQLAAGIQLPDVLATYVESIGSFVLSSGATVVPYVNNYASWVKDNVTMVDPLDFLDEDEIAECAGEWPLHAITIVKYNGATTRAARSGMKFRVVNNTDLTGRVEMVVSYQRIGDMLLPKAPQTMSEAEAQLGVCYRFRNYNEKDIWAGAHKELLFDAFTAIPCEPRVVFSDVCVAAFKGATILTN